MTAFSSFRDFEKRLSPPPQKPSALEAIYAVGHWLLGCERAVDAARVFRIMVRTAPHDERGWLGLGLCHEKATQPHVAAELYGTGSVVAGPDGGKSVRCLLARARLLAEFGTPTENLLDEAAQCAAEQGSEVLEGLVQSERERLS